MVLASALSQVKGKNYNYAACCISAQCCMPCVAAYLYKDLAPHYGISEPLFCIKCCLPLLSYYQLLDTIMVKEGLHMTMGAVAPDSAGGPLTAEDMQR